jgi:hypothetical protein
LPLLLLLLLWVLFSLLVSSSIFDDACVVRGANFWKLFWISASLFPEFRVLGLFRVSKIQKSPKTANMNTPWCSLSVLFARMVSWIIKTVLRDDIL